MSHFIGTPLMHYFTLTPPTMLPHYNRESIKQCLLMCSMAKKIPKHITLILNETDTIFLLDLSSSIVLKDSIEGAAAETDNQHYDFLTSEKGRNRKLSSIGVQTFPLLMKTRSTAPEKYEYRDNSTFASNWEMYDTYKEGIVAEDDAFRDIGKEEDVPNIEEEEIDVHKLNEEIDRVKRSKLSEEMEKLMNNQKYFDAALVIERLLANNCYNEEQKQFKGLDQTELITLKYDYKLDLLWTFANEDTKNRCVTGVCFNDFTEDIMAVAYGKYYFKDRKSTGVVMIWNIKNPKQPERQYFFQHSVTSITFSRANPNFLAVGFYNGHVKILDVSKRELTIFREDLSTSFEPVWSMLCLDDDFDSEYFLACFGDGQICKYQITATHLNCVQIMKIAKVEGKLRGLQAMRLFEGNQASSSRSAPAVCMTLHPSDTSLYLVGTSEGVIHRCTAHYCKQHLDMFKAHEGSIHRMKFSPFVNKVYATCGDDFQMCLWIEGISEPLIVSRYCREPVLDLDWSPTHSTILVSLQGMDIFMWDFQRKIYEPQSQTKSPSNSKNTFCKFTASGRCLIVGDIDGNVHIFSVSGLPIPAFFQENLFLESVNNILVTNPELVRKLHKLGSLNFKKKNTN